MDRLTFTNRAFNPLGMFWAMLIAFLVVLALGFATPSLAQETRAQRLLNERFIGFPDATVNSTFNTTSYVDLPGATVTFNPMVDPTVSGYYGGPLQLDYIVVLFTADVSKATATSGTCALYVNGAVLAKSERTATFAAGASSLAFAYVVPNTLATSQTVKVQCKSADTNVFTVADAQLQVRERW